MPLMESVRRTQAVAEAVEAKDFERAMSLRSGSFKDAFLTFKTMVRALPHPIDPTRKRFRIAVMHAGAPAPGMNTAARAAIRLGLDRGHIMLGVRNGFEGLIEGELETMDWMSVSGWAIRGGSMLGTTRRVPKGRDLYSIARVIEDHRIDALLIIGGWTAYETAFHLMKERPNFPSFNIPMICLPASINNNLPGSEFSIGADTALNSIVDAVDKIKQSAVATRRVFVVEVMGHYCGYLALLGGIATGAERVYLHEEGVKLRDLQMDVEKLLTGFHAGKRLGLMIRNEYANPVYTTDFMCSLFTEEGRGVFDVRPAILGHLQQGGDPSPFDRIQATRLAGMCLDYLLDQCEKGEHNSAFIGIQNGQILFHDMRDFDRMIDAEFQRPKDQWWLGLKHLADLLSKTGPSDEVG
jgi:6-phosphofructokinase 1